MKCCATCIHLKRICDGECKGCSHKVEEDLRNIEKVLNDEIGCKCLICYDEDSGKFKFWEEDEEMTKLLEGQE